MNCILAVLPAKTVSVPVDNTPVVKVTIRSAAAVNIIITTSPTKGAVEDVPTPIVTVNAPVNAAKFTRVLLLDGFSAMVAAYAGVRYSLVLILSVLSADGVFGNLEIVLILNIVLRGWN